MSDAPASSTSGALFRLRDLLEHPALGLETLVDVAGAAERRVSGVHAVETEHPARWLAPDWVMLTTGVRLVGDPAAQARLAVELAEAGVAALGFGCGLDFDVVPGPLLAAAADVGLPVFGVPLQTPFRDIEAYVHRALLSSELRTLQRLSSMQRYLVDALYDPEPQRTVVHRLATVLESSVAVVRGDGSVEEAVGAVPDGLRGLLVDPARGARDLELGAWRGVLAPVAADPADPEDRWLVAANRDRPVASRLVRPVLGAAAPLLAAVGRLEGTVRAQDRALRRGLLEDLVAGAGDDQELQARAAACGMDLRGVTRVLALAPRAGTFDPAARDRQERRVGRALDARGVPNLVAADRERVVALLGGPQGDALEDALLRELTADGDVRIGVGRSGRGVAAIRRSAEDAHVAVALVGDDPARAWTHYGDVGLPALVVGQLPAERVAPQVRAVLRTLDARPGSREALAAYFAYELDVTAAAASLHLHPNSLRYRLSRLSAALGRSLRDPETIATLVLALEVERRAGGRLDDA